MALPFARAHYLPLVVAVPGVLAVTDPVARVPSPTALTGVKVYGFLKTLTAGTATVKLKNGAGTVLATLNWTATGLQSAAFTDTIAAEDEFKIEVSAIGVGAADLTLAIWVTANTQN